MLRFLSSIFVVFTCSCIAPRVHKTFPVYSEMVNTIVEVTKQTLVEQGVYKKEDLDRAEKERACSIYELNVISFSCISGGSSFKCYGEFVVEVGKLSITYGKKYKDKNTILAHELIHFFDYIIAGIIDPMHKKEKVFELGCHWKIPADNPEEMKKCKESSVEGRIREKLKNLDN
jgi:hypothetical protein